MNYKSLTSIDQKILDTLEKLSESGKRLIAECEIVLESNYSSAVVRNSLRILEREQLVESKPRSCTYPGDFIWKTLPK